MAATYREPQNKQVVQGHNKLGSLGELKHVLKQTDSEMSTSKLN